MHRPVSTPRELAAVLHAPAPAERPRDGFAPRLHYPLGSAQAEVVAVAAGLKPVLRSTLSLAAADEALARYRRLGLHGLVTRPGDEHGAARLYLGGDRARIAAAARADEARDDRELGRLLGYPRCCVEAFLAVPQPRTAAAAAHATWSGARGVASPRLNCIDRCVFHYVPWDPCSPACELSRRYADAVAASVATVAPRVASLRGDVDLVGFVAAVDRALAAHRLHVLAGVQLSLEGPASAGTVEVRAARATAVDRAPGSPLADDERDAVAALLARIVPGARVAVADETLHLDERPLVRAPHLFLACFEAMS